MDVMTHSELIAAIDAFQKRHPEIGDARIGREVSGETGLVARLRAGSSPTLRILNEIAGFFARKDQEAGLNHPRGVATTADVGSPGKTGDFTAAASA